MSSQIFTLPDVGEGLTEAEIISWKVAQGDPVALNQVVVEIETAKSLVELPSPFAGTMSKLLVAEGETIEVGTPIYEVAGEGSEQSSEPKSGAENDATPEAAPSAESGEMKPLVGTGPKAESGGRRRRRALTKDVISAPEHPPVEMVELEAATPAQLRALAKPPVRKAAKDAGVNLLDCTATGAHGEVTKKDLENYLSQRSSTAGSSRPQGQGSSGGSFDAAVFTGAVDSTPVRGVRKMTANAMVDSAFSAPHVSIFKEIDASATMAFVASLKKRPEFEGVRVSPLLVAAKAVIYALGKNLEVNSSWGGEEILTKRFVNLGIAAATPRGLVVPNIRDAHTMSFLELARAINELTETARAGKTQPAQMQQGTFTITNIGVLGVDTGTPIINPGEAGILAFGAVRQKPWVVDGQIVPRWVTTLGGSFDHRIIDGEAASRFLVDVARVLEDPTTLLN